MVSEALQSLAGHDLSFISSGKAECPLTDKNKVGIEKTRKKEGQIERATLAASVMLWVSG